ncbi:hypothetical protein [Actinoplanes sp. NPDC026670]|uniref:hypothetical protein n=1 Tax=Actinoplanes sp. NPDC026670 TaxID=3154700 RepID=UPI00340D68C6
MRPRADLAIAPVYLLTFLAFTAMVVPVATTWVRHDVDAIPAVLILAGEVLVLRLIATESERLPRMIPLVAAGIVNALLMVFVAMSVQMWLLDGGRAQEIRATVAKVYDGHSGAPFYDLEEDGVPLPGRLTEWPGDGAGELGDKVTVVQDRQGLVDPLLPETYWQDVADDPRVLLLPTVGILAALCLAAVWPSRTRKDLNLSRDPS